MASTTAFFTGLSGLNANARNLDVIGNNIANVNTTAFKSNRMLFSSQFSRTFSIGSIPSADSGGTNPGQIGLGVAIAGTQRDFSSGALSTTGDQRDLAIEGNGFFIVNRAGSQHYTRAGAFRQNSENDLVNVSGDRVQGYSVDSDFNIVPGRLGDLNIPIGQLTLAQATRNVRFTGNLNANGTLPTHGTHVDLDPLTLVSGPIPPSGDALETTSLLVDINDPTNTGNPMFIAGQVLELNNAEKGNRTIPTAQLAITATTTVQDFMDFLTQALGINTTASPNPDGGIPGVSLDPVTGVLSVTGNTGTVNNIGLGSSDLRVLDAAGTVLGSPLVTTTPTQADGESIRTTFVAYDSLGTPINVDLAMVLDSRSATGTTWRYFVESPDDTDLNLAVGTGTVDFDSSGQLSTATPITITIDRDNTGAMTPLSIDLSLASQTGSVTALTDTGSSLAATFQDGSQIGTLASFAVGPDGIISGAFTNGLTRTIGQVALANFANPGGLVDVGSNLFSTGPNSGTAVVAAPGSLGAGRVVGGALELSNVDLSQEFINLILTSTGYSASSRVITTTDQLMQQLLVLGR
jgi:flagellar hook protein FlgE